VGDVFVLVLPELGREGEGALNEEAGAEGEVGLGAGAEEIGVDELFVEAIAGKRGLAPFVDDLLEKLPDWGTGAGQQLARLLGGVSSEVGAE
jgi:hypothetical protein